MQVLNRAKEDEFIQVEVEKLWQDIGGGQIGLTPDGDYITLDGVLVEDPQLFGIMPDMEKRKAEKWWRQLQDRKDAEAKTEAEGKPEVVPSQEEQPSPDDGGIVAAITMAMNAMQQQQHEFLKALAATLTPRAPTVTPEPSNFNAVYSCRKGKGSIVKPPQNWDDLGFGEMPEWWGKKEQHTITNDDGVEFVYRRFFVSDEG